MSWAANYIEQLKNGKDVSFRPRGNSMVGKINSGDLVTVVPLNENFVLVKDLIVLCKVNGAQYLHLIKAVDGERCQIGNNKGKINGWTSRKNIYGVVTEIEGKSTMGKFLHETSLLEPDPWMDEPLTKEELAAVENAGQGGGDEWK